MKVEKMKVEKMKVWGKVNRVAQVVSAIVAVVVAVIVPFAEYRMMNVYVDRVPQDSRSGLVITFLLVFIFGYIPLAFVSFFVGCAMVAGLWSQRKPKKTLPLGGRQEKNSLPFSVFCYVATGAYAFMAYINFAMYISSCQKVTILAVIYIFACLLFVFTATLNLILRRIDRKTAQTIQSTTYLQE